MPSLLRQLVRAAIPSRANRYRPRFLTSPVAGVVLGLIVLFEFGFLAQSSLFTSGERFLTSVLPGALAALSNEARKAEKVPPLAEDARLAQAAELKAKDMALRGYFSHKTPEGEEPWIFLDNVGYSYTYAGENLAINFSDSEEVTSAWLRSPTHRANLLDPNFSRVGFGVATGTYEGREVAYIVQFLAAPSPENAAPVPATPRTPAVTSIPSGEPEVRSHVAGHPAGTPPATRGFGSMFTLGLFSVMGILFLFSLFLKFRAERREALSNSLLVLSSFVGLILFFEGHSFHNVEIPETAASVHRVGQR